MTEQLEDLAPRLESAHEEVNAKLALLQQDKSGTEEMREKARTEEGELAARQRECAAIAEGRKVAC